MSKLLASKLLVLSSVASPAITMAATSNEISAVQIGSTLLTSRDVVDIHLVDETGPNSTVHIAIGEQARRSIYEYTAKHIGQNIDVSVDGRRVMSIPIRQPLEAPFVMISGGDDDALQIARSLAGSVASETR